MSPGSDHKKKFHPRKMLITGILFLVPLAVTFWLLNFLVQKTNIYARPLVNSALHAILADEAIHVPEWILVIISLAVVIVFIILIGWLANFYIGKRMLSLVDSAMLRLPFIRSIYGGVKQIIEAFNFQGAAGGSSFKKVVMFEYPRKGCWALGFVTNENTERSRQLYGRELTAVFMPSTPNPTTGFLLYLNPFDLYLIDIKVEEAVKLIVSAGLVTPEITKLKQITLGESLRAEAEKQSAPAEERALPSNDAPEN